MILNFGNRLARDLVEERASKEVRAYPSQLIRATRLKLAMLHSAREVDDLMIPPGNRLEKLKGDRREFYSIRINAQYRIVFRFQGGNAEDVTVEDYHK